jgi:hypothetical protein
MIRNDNDLAEKGCCTVQGGGGFGDSLRRASERQEINCPYEGILARALPSLVRFKGPLTTARAISLISD